MMDKIDYTQKTRCTLILVSPFKYLGGVAMHYRGLRGYWRTDVRYYEVFKMNNSIIVSLFKAFWNYLRFIIMLIISKPKTVVSNISLKRGFYSQIYYVRLAKMFNANIVTYIHGWDVDEEWMLTTTRGQYILDNSDEIIVLSKQFENKLKAAGCLKKIYISTTKVDDRLLEGFCINKRVGELKKFLFLSRVEREKGVFLALDIFKMLQEDNLSLSFTIAGHGSAIEEVKRYVIDNNISNVCVCGRVDGPDIGKIFAESDCFFLLSQSEGMPAALLEAMAFGLPAVTCPVGGIPDFFVDNEMGIISNSMDPQYYYKRIKDLMDNPLKIQKMSQTNYTYAKEKFYASAVAVELEAIFDTSSM